MPVCAASPQRVALGRRVGVERQRRGRRGRFGQPRRQLEAERIGQLLDLRQIAEIAQAEPLEELARGRVHERPADHLLAADGLDQPALDQRRQDAAAAADAADLGDLGGGDRLLVGDDRQRLERLHRELLRGPVVEQLAHPLVQLGPGHDLIAAGDFDHLQAAGRVVVGAQRRPAPHRCPHGSRLRAACTASSASPARATRRSGLQRWA